MRIAFGLVSLVCWGLWAFLPKLAQKHLGDTLSAVMYQYVGSFACVVAMSAYHGRFAPVWSGKGAMLAAAAGVFATVGSFFYYRAAANEDVALVSTVTALYPIVAITLAWILLGERLAPRQWLGIGLALVSMALIAPRK